MKVKTLATCFALLMVTSSNAQRTPTGPPIAGRPTDFSNIVGSYRIEASASPLEVRVEEPITLTVRILGSGDAKFEPRRKLLNVLPDWSQDFFVEPVPDEDQVSKDKKVWTFVYRLRPKHVKVPSIEGITLSYFSPKTNDYARSYADPIDIIVKPKRDETHTIEAAMEAPDSFWRIDPSRAALEQQSPSVSLSLVSIVAAVLTPPVVCMLIFVVWTRLRPDETRRRKHQRRSAAQRALAALKSNRTISWMAVCKYLHERFEFAVDDPTPEDVWTFLKRRGFLITNCDAGRAFFQQCDLLRFAQDAPETTPLNDEAARLIEALEGDPCAR